MSTSLPHEPGLGDARDEAALSDDRPQSVDPEPPPVGAASWSQNLSMAVCVLFGFAYFAWIAWTESWRFWLVAALVGAIGALGFVLHRVMAGLRQRR